MILSNLCADIEHPSPFMILIQQPPIARRGQSRQRTSMINTTLGMGKSFVV
jgi:hypothetical protein